MVETLVNRVIPPSNKHRIDPFTCNLDEYVLLKLYLGHETEKLAMMLSGNAQEVQVQYACQSVSGWVRAPVEGEISPISSPHRGYLMLPGSTVIEGSPVPEIDWCLCLGQCCCLGRKSEGVRRMVVVVVVVHTRLPWDV
ncbi:hypothetical protein O3P69_014817 [Scylla paramamosain]|uniref:Uncharacterized protein n=1 Tax=Scylla paramamosain TaxID=85552 RepID=A0AAW0U2L9_SCYPA